jgi:hypothetical protein
MMLINFILITLILNFSIKKVLMNDEDTLLRITGATNTFSCYRVLLKIEEYYLFKKNSFDCYEKFLLINFSLADPTNTSKIFPASGYLTPNLGCITDEQNYDTECRLIKRFK